MLSATIVPRGLISSILVIAPTLSISFSTTPKLMLSFVFSTVVMESVGTAFDIVDALISFVDTFSPSPSFKSYLYVILMVYSLPDSRFSKTLCSRLSAMIVPF